MKVLDANANIAYLRAEPGGDVVRDLVENQDEELYSHALNLCELFYDFSRSDDVLVASRAVNTLLADGLLIREDMDIAFWQDAAQIKADWRRISLADCCGLALARRLDCDFVTSDHHEIDVLKEAKVARVLFFR